MIPTVVNNGILDAAGAAAFTALVVQQTKFAVEYAVKPSNPQHDNILRLYVDIVAMVIVIVAELVSGAMNVHNGAAWFTAVIQGFGVGVAAIAGYHLLNGMQPQTDRNLPTTQTGSALDDSALLAALQNLVARGAATALQQITVPAQSTVSLSPAGQVAQPTPLPGAAPDVAPVQDAEPAPASAPDDPALFTTPAAPPPSMSSNGAANNLAGAGSLQDTPIS